MARQMALMARSHRMWCVWDRAPRTSSSDARIAAAGCHEERRLVLGGPQPPGVKRRGRRRAAATGEGEEAVELRSCKSGRGGRNDLAGVPTAAPHRVSPAGEPRVRDEYGTGWLACGTRAGKKCQAAGARTRGLWAGAPMPAESMDGRVFACERCQAEVVVCRRCDRGQRYCGRTCRAQVRRTAQRGSGSRYQRSWAGRSAHAQRQARYRQRQRQKKVTHQGSQEPSGGAVLASEPAAQVPAPQEAAHAAPDRECVAEIALATVPSPLAQAAAPPRWRCHWCTRACESIVHGARQAEPQCEGRRVHLLAPPGVRPRRRGRTHGPAP